MHCQHCNTSFPTITAFLDHARAISADLATRCAERSSRVKDVDTESTTVVHALSSMGDPESAVRAALLALADLVDVERYQEDAHAAELAELLAAPGHSFQAMAVVVDGLNVERCRICSQSYKGHREPLSSASRIRDIEADHGYRRGWNMRSKILAKRVRDIAAALDASPVVVQLDDIDDVNALPSHASGAV